MRKVCDLEPGDFVHTFGMSTLYLNHVDQAREQLTRDTRELPTMRINPDIKDLFAFRFEDFELLNYDPHPHIKAASASDLDFRFFSRMRFSLFAAVAANGVIGKDNDLIWTLRDDMAFFKTTTMVPPCDRGGRPELEAQSHSERFRPIARSPQHRAVP